MKTAKISKAKRLYYTMYIKYYLVPHIHRYIQLYQPTQEEVEASLQDIGDQLCKEKVKPRWAFLFPIRITYNDTVKYLITMEGDVFKQIFYDDKVKMIDIYRTQQ